MLLEEIFVECACGVRLCRRSPGEFAERDAADVRRGDLPRCPSAAWKTAAPSHLGVTPSSSSPLTCHSRICSCKTARQITIPAPVDASSLWSLLLSSHPKLRYATSRDQALMMAYERRKRRGNVNPPMATQASNGENAVD